MKRETKDSRIQRVKLVLFDVDGVLTDGTIYLRPDGHELKAFNAQDGSGIKHLQRGGIEVAILSGRQSSAVNHRARELGIRFALQNYKRKLDGLERVMALTGVPCENICVVGDDLPDVPIMRKAGLAVAVANARPEVIACAHWVTHAAGGQGAAREVAEEILKVQGKWADILARYDLVPPKRPGKRK